MRCGMRKRSKLKVRGYYNRLIGLDEYLAAFPGGKASDNIGDI